MANLTKTVMRGNTGRWRGRCSFSIVFEEVEDDYRDDEYDSDMDLLQSDDEDFCSGDESDENDEEYMDSDEEENGNLKGFVVNDTDEDEDYSEEDEVEYEE